MDPSAVAAAAGAFESEVETLIKTAVGEEKENGSILLAAQCYTAASEMLVARTQQLGKNDGFFVSMRARLLEYLERARLLTDIAIDEERAAAEAVAAAPAINKK